MGEHGTWFDYLNRFSWWQHFNAPLEHALGRKWKWHDVRRAAGRSPTSSSTLLVVLFVACAAASRSARPQAATDKGLVPPRKMNLRNFFEYTAESVYGMVEGAMGEQTRARFFPLIGALWMFILFGNLIGLIPGFVSPNDTLKTNVGIALHGVRPDALLRRQGARPRVLQALPRPDAGARAADAADRAHQPLRAPAVARRSPHGQHDGRPQGRHVASSRWCRSLVPLPFMLLGLLVCLIQALVFCTLTMVYIGMAMEHEEH